MVKLNQTKATPSKSQEWFKYMMWSWGHLSATYRPLRMAVLPALIQRLLPKLSLSIMKSILEAGHALPTTHCRAPRNHTDKAKTWSSLCKCTISSRHEGMVVSAEGRHAFFTTALKHIRAISFLVLALKYLQGISYSTSWDWDQGILEWLC